MIPHLDLGPTPFTRSKTLKLLLDAKQIQFAGNAKLKIYGRLNCRSGKRMKAGNRIFFKSEAEALQLGYRPCGHCMVEKYKKWRG